MADTNENTVVIKGDAYLKVVSRTAKAKNDKGEAPTLTRILPMPKLSETMTDNQIGKSIGDWLRQLAAIRDGAEVVIEKSDGTRIPVKRTPDRGFETPLGGSTGTPVPVNPVGVLSMLRKGVSLSHQQPMNALLVERFGVKGEKAPKGARKLATIDDIDVE